MIDSMRYCIHHLNDFSGSPLILRERMESIAAQGPVTLITNGGTGFLSTWDGPVVRFDYTKYENKILRFVSLSVWYCRVVSYLARHLKSGDILILSTLISSPLLLVFFLKRGIKAEVFVNEIFFRVPVWRSVGLMAMGNDAIYKTYLSKFVRDTWQFSGPCRIVYPKLREPLMSLASGQRGLEVPNIDRLRFFLVCSQIDAKGYRLFIKIAEHFERMGEDHAFALYLSGSQEHFASDYPLGTLPKNLSIHFNQTSPEIFFGHDIFLGLTDPSQWIETFGQTFAEAMIAGNIAVVPPLGAQLEYVEDGDNGFLFQEYSLQGILTEIDRICSLPDLLTVRVRARDSIMKFLQSHQVYHLAWA